MRDQQGTEWGFGVGAFLFHPSIARGISYNEDMTRRAWLFIALGAALLAGCVFGWKWSERPPYKFMDGAELWLVEQRGGAYTLTYTTESPLDAVAARAQSNGFELKYTKDLGDAWASVGVSPRFEISRWYGWRIIPPISPETSGFITVSDVAPSPVLRLRAWLFDLRRPRDSHGI